MTSPQIQRVTRVEIAASDIGWDFADARRTEIDAHFAAKQAANPALWNGRVLLTRAAKVADDAVTGTCFETDFASFLAWRDWGFPDPEVANVFAQAALRSADGAFLLGIMGADTANAGRVYFPSGTPEPADIVAGRLDLAANLMRELGEETGLTAGDVAPAADWTAIQDGQRLALLRIVDAPESADALAARILDHVARDDHPELAGIHVARSPADIVPAMPPFVAAFLRHVWADGGS
jgi:8-oxo-dGTP pyrophosphatase MutT (NUDIX family)